MSQVQPADRGNEIIEQLNSLAIEDASEFELVKIEREVESIKNAVEPSRYLEIKGMISCLRRDVKMMRKYHENALSYSSHHAMSHFQYAASLGKCGMFEEAYNHAKEAFVKDKAKMSLSKAIELGSFVEAEDVCELVDEWKRNYPDEGLPLLSDDHDIASYALEALDKSLKKNPGLMVPIDPDQIDRISKLVEEVEVD